MSQKPTKIKVLDQIEEEASACLREFHSCAPCCLSTLLEHLDLADKPTTELFQKAVMSLSGGIVQEHETCGALLSGIMAIGIVSSPNKREGATRDDMMASMKPALEYYRKFEKEIGHVRCFDIRRVGLGRCFDTADPDEYAKFEAAGGHELCGKVVGKAARLAAEIIIDLRQRQAAKLTEQ